MASDIKKLLNSPDVSFIDNISVDELRDELINDFQEKYYELTGDYEILGELDKYRILINGISLKLFHGYQHIEKTGKMNLLKYSEGNYLLHLGMTRGIEKNEEKAATCEITFYLSDLQPAVVAIPKGTQITAGDGVYFETETYAEILPGQENVTTRAICQMNGTIGNDYVVGQLNILVDPIAYVEKVKNTTATMGGEDIMTDEEYREKIYLAPSSFSTAGTEDSYAYWVKEYSLLIKDVKVTSPEDDTIKIIVLLKDGEIPDENFLNNLKEFLTKMNVKPLTEKVVIDAPNTVPYNVSGSYYINASDKNQVQEIQEAVAKAQAEYVTWQKEKIGRDINPFHLQYLLMKAGVKRIELVEPIFNDVDDSSIAMEGSINLVYGGIEDD